MKNKRKERKKIRKKCKERKKRRRRGKKVYLLSKAEKLRRLFEAFEQLGRMVVVWWFLCVDIQRAHLMEIVCNMLLRI